jgi:protein SCO1/2
MSAHRIFRPAAAGLLTVSLLSGLAAGAVQAQPLRPAPAASGVESQAGPSAPASRLPQVSTQGQMSAAHNYFGDVKLINQDGQEMRLYSDLLAGKTVVINVVFTTCSSACPAMSAAFAKIQDHLGDRLGQDVRLISISVDPQVDTPAKLKEYAARFKARPGWYFLTGSQANVEEALKKLGQYVENKEDHMNIFLIGNERTGLWKKAFGLSSPQQLFPILDSVIDDAGSQG